MHARRGDFEGWCGDVPREECLAPLAAYARRVREVQDELRGRRGLAVAHVLMTSDERDPAWWAQVRALGWRYVDYERARTVELLIR